MWFYATMFLSLAFVALQFLKYLSNKDQIIEKERKFQTKLKKLQDKQRKINEKQEKAERLKEEQKKAKENEIKKS